MQPKPTENVRFRLDDELKAKWVQTCEARKIVQQEAIQSLIGWFCQQDATVQAMIFDQIPAAPDLVAMVVKRLGKKR